tara:strand:- start:42 stop:1889 length:1848 start_codon:yes stop_codon:yes gene_type:complete
MQRNRLKEKKNKKPKDIMDNNVEIIVNIGNQNNDDHQNNSKTDSDNSYIIDDKPIDKKNKNKPIDKKNKNKPIDKKKSKPNNDENDSELRTKKLLDNLKEKVKIFNIKKEKLISEKIDIPNDIFNLPKDIEINSEKDIISFTDIINNKILQLDNIKPIQIQNEFPRQIQQNSSQIYNTGISLNDYKRPLPYIQQAYNPNLPYMQQGFNPYNQQRFNPYNQQSIMNQLINQRPSLGPIIEEIDEQEIIAVGEPVIEEIDKQEIIAVGDPVSMEEIDNIVPDPDRQFVEDSSVQEEEEIIGVGIPEQEEEIIGVGIPEQEEDEDEFTENADPIDQDASVDNNEFFSGTSLNLLIERKNELNSYLVKSFDSERSENVVDFLLEKLERRLEKIENGIEAVTKIPPSINEEEVDRIVNNGVPQDITYSEDGKRGDFATAVALGNSNIRNSPIPFFLKRDDGNIVMLKKYVVPNAESYNEPILNAYQLYINGEVIPRKYFNEYGDKYEMIDTPGATGTLLDYGITVNPVPEDPNQPPNRDLITVDPDGRRPGRNDSEYPDSRQTSMDEFLNPTQVPESNEFSNPLYEEPSGEIINMGGNTALDTLLSNNGWLANLRNTLIP